MTKCQRWGVNCLYSLSWYFTKSWSSERNHQVPLASAENHSQCMLFPMFVKQQRAERAEHRLATNSNSFWDALQLRQHGDICPKKILKGLIAIAYSSSRNPFFVNWEFICCTYRKIYFWEASCVLYPENSHQPARLRISFFQEAPSDWETHWAERSQDQHNTMEILSESGVIPLQGKHHKETGQTQLFFLYITSKHVYSMSYTKK